MVNQKFKYPIVNSSTLIKEASKKKNAVAHFNAMNLLYIKSILEVSNDLKIPVIIAVTEAKIEFLGGLKNFKDMVENTIMENNYKTTVAIHLDHSQSMENCLKAIEVGFSSVMYDGSKLPIKENIFNLKKIISVAKENNVSIEAEIGSIGGVEDGVIGLGISASVNDAKEMKEVGIDLLAAGIGNMHGRYPKEWKELNFNLLKQIKEVSGKSLVLHGASGVPNDQIRKAIKLGVNKINVSSELNWAFGNSLKNDFIENEIYSKNNWQDPRILFVNPFRSLKEKIKEKIELFSGV